MADTILTDDRITFNRTEPEQRRRKFADKLPTQSIPDDWVEPFMQHVFEHHPQTFRCAMSAVVGLDDAPKPGRRRNDG